VITNAHFERFDTAKYRSRNPIQRALIRRFALAVREYFVEADPRRSVLEVGVGEGFLSGYLLECFPDRSFIGVDVNEPDIRRLRAKFPGIEAQVGSAYDLSAWRTRRDIDLVLCCEVLEHLEQPELALQEILSVGPKYVIASVPHEPFFMASNLLRGKNVRRLGNDEEHINHWGRRSFRDLLSKQFEVVRMTTTFPWIVALLRPRVLV
jgi:SAM-dependent methyltransferase